MILTSDARLVRGTKIYTGSLYIGALGLVLTVIIVPNSALAVSALITLQAILTAVVIYTSTMASGALVSALNLVVSGVGSISSSLYIGHMPFLAKYAGDKISASVLYDWRIWWAPSLLVVIVSHHFYERHFIKFRTRFKREGAARVGMRLELHGSKPHLVEASIKDTSSRHKRPG